MTLSEQCMKIKGELESLIGKYNVALKAKNLDDMTALESAIKAAESEFAEQSQADLFSVCKKAENPILEGVKQYTYPIIKHRMMRDGEIVTGMELVDDREKQIDLVKLCKFCGLPMLWAYKVEKAGELLCIRTAKELGMTVDEIKRIAKTYRMAKAAEEVNLGGTPTSNTQICKILQMVIDDILFEDDGSGKNKYKANSHDVAYLLMCYTKRGRKQLSVTVAKVSFLHGLIVDVMHRITCGLKYSLEYQMIREDKAEKADDKTANAEAQPASEVDEAEDDEVMLVEREEAK